MTEGIFSLLGVHKKDEHLRSSLRTWHGGSKQFGSGTAMITTTPTFAYSLVQVPHKCGTVPAL